MKIFVTGASGFVGRALTQFLSSQGHETGALVHNHDQNTVNQLWFRNGPILFQGDIRDFKRLREIFYSYKPDAIVHLAAQAIVSQAHVDPYSTFDVNVNGTIALLEAWREACPNAQFLYFSTDKVYGNGLNKKESDPIVATGNAYQVSKAAADLIAQSYLPNITITRSCNIYGPGDTHPSRLVPDMIKSLLEGRTPILKMPRAKREWIYIDDVCSLVANLIEHKRTGIWNIGSGQVVTVWEVLRQIHNCAGDLTKYGELEFKEADLAFPELSEQSLDTSKLCSEMDCLAFTILQAGIKRTVEWWRTQHPS